MCSEHQKTMIERDMAAYDSLPPCLKKVFDEAPRKVSVNQAMSNVRMKAYRDLLGDEKFARKLKEIIEAQAAMESYVPVC